MNKLSRISLPSTMEEIHYFAFGNSNPKEKWTLDLPNLTEIGVCAFMACSNIVEATLPIEVCYSSMPAGGLSAFWDCNQIEKIHFVKGNKGDGMGFDYFDDSKFYTPTYLSRAVIKEITFGEGIVAIGAGLCTGQYNIKEVKFPGTLKEVHT